MLIHAQTANEHGFIPPIHTGKNAEVSNIVINIVILYD